MINTILINGMWQGALIVAIAAVVASMQPKRHAATRYAIWFAALLALAIVPVLSLWHPEPTLSSMPASVAATIAATSKAADASGLWLLMLWLGGAGLGLARLALSYARINRIVRYAVPAPHLGSEVATSDEVSIPIATGLLTPVIVIPQTLADTLDRSDLDRIISHERAHLRRRDFAGNLLQRVIEACLFFNPWTYIIGRQLIAEREAACDDWAVHALGEPHRYASCLAEIAQGARGSKIPLLTPSAIGPGNLLVARIDRLLSGNVMQLKVNHLALAAIIAAFGILSILLQSTLGVTTSSNASANQNAPSNVASTTTTQTCNSEAHPVNAVAPNAPPGSKGSASAAVTIGADGTTLNAKIIQSSGNPAFDAAVVTAAMQSTYSPKMAGCRPTTGGYVYRADAGP